MQKVGYLKTYTSKKAPAHGILNGLVYTPKKSYETISHLSALFSGDLVSAKHYMHVNTDAPEPDSPYNPGIVAYKGLPLKDYPMVLTEKSAIEIR